ASPIPQAKGALIVAPRYDDTLSTSVGAVYVFSPTTGANSPPALDHIGHKTLPSCRLFAFTATATDPDSPAQSLTFSISGAPPLAQIDPVSGRFTWDPYPQQGGEGGATFTFDVVVSDTDLADRETVTLTVPECDEDGDGLLDIWEIFGVDANGDGIIDLDLPALGADPRRKDIFVEVDYLERTGLDAEAIIQALDLVKQAFARAPVENPASWWNGINLHVHISDAISLRRPGYFRDTNPDLFSHSAGDTYFKDNTPSNYGDGDYSTTILGLYELRRMLANRDLDAAADENSYWREQALKKIQHYALLVDKFHGENYESDEEKNFIQYDYSASSGLGEPYGNDFAVAVGNLTNTSDAFLASVFMHELGHNLGRDHGGPIPPDRATILAPALDKDNCKPNYLSVMNYTFNFPIIVADRPLDYSRSQMDLLDENNLDESKGVSISTPPGLWTAYGISPSQDPRLIETGRWVDWNDNNPITATHGTVDSNINAFSMGGNRCSNTEKTLLEGYDDWQNLKLNFRDALYYGIGGGAVGGPVLALTSQRRLPKGIKPIPFSEELTRKEIEHMISNSRTGRIRPIDLTATAVSGEHINLRWKKGKLSEPQVAGYKIMRKLSKQRRWETIVPITGSKATAYADRNLEPKTAYDYTISALTIGGVTSFPSVPATATTHEAGLSRFAVLVAAVIAVVLIFAGIAISRKRSPA
ncbi:MAG: hypothetical protein H8D75_01830, partial [Rhodospirillaceae bacterium]|nr:hypothetical protein [Rhodospirillaceae bacterium]